MQSSKVRKGSTRLVIGAAAVAAALTGTAIAVQDAWIRLGEQRTSTAMTSTMVPTNSTKGTVCAVRLRAIGAPLDIAEITVHFSNHQSLHFSKEINLAGNSDSIPFNLPGIRRRVSGVDVLYKIPNPTLPAPDVEIWGDTMPGFNYCPH